MDLRQLEYFLASAKYLSFTRAARECCIVQSAMSQQILALEKDLGVQLFERTNRGLRLTPEGEVMLREARRLLDQAEITREIVRQSRHSFTSVLRVGCHGNLQRRALPAALSRFRREYPHTRVLISSGIYQELLNQLREGMIDCLIALDHNQMAELDWVWARPICEEPIYVMLCTDHPLVQKEVLCMRDLENLPLVLFSGEDKKQLLRSMADRGISAPLYAYTDSQNSIETLVAGGYGVSMCVRSAMRIHPGIAYRPLQDRACSHSIFMVRRDSDAQERTDALLSDLLMAQTE